MAHLRETRARAMFGPRGKRMVRCETLTVMGVERRATIAGRSIRDGASRLAMGVGLHH